ncbi:hypothetical protein WEI85_34885 [Actinomycetes bacterium KLBMP 9797]
MSEVLKPDQHWLLQWMDEFGATDRSTVAARLKSSDSVSRLFDLAVSHRTVDYSTVPLSNVVVAGPWLDPSATFMCSGINCQKRHIELNFGRVLHYFDFVMLEGPSASAFAIALAKASMKRDFSRLSYGLGASVEFLQYVRSIGLDKHLIFADKVCGCRPHLLEGAEKIDAKPLVDLAELDRLAKQLAKDGGVKVKPDGPDRWYGVVTHPNFRGTSGHIFKQSEEPRREDVARWLLDSWLQSAVYDSATAQQLGAPLVSLAPSPIFDRTTDVQTISVDDVAARIRIPALESLPLRDLIALRNHESDQFIRFRAVLREAIAETLEKGDTDSPERIAEKVWQNKVKPAVADINRKIAANNRSLRDKLIAASAVGTVAGAIGAVATMPWLIGIGLVAAGAPLHQYFKAREERQKIEAENDMYFMWKVSQHHG